MKGFVCFGGTRVDLAYLRNLEEKQAFAFVENGQTVEVGFAYQKEQVHAYLNFDYFVDEPLSLIQEAALHFDHYTVASFEYSKQRTQILGMLGYAYFFPNFYITYF